jgi:hypothetical protein
MNIDVKKHKQFLNNIPEFYKNVLTSWIKTGGGQLSSPKYFFSNVINLFPHKICFITLLNVNGELN